MCAGFVYRPHVETADGVFTPDIVLDRLVVASGNHQFPVSVERLVCGDAIEVVGDATRARGAVALIAASAGALLGIGSDHLDGALADDPGRARQICAKPLARAVWRFAEVADHLEEILLRTETVDGAGRSRETETALSAIAALPKDGAVPRATVVLAHPGDDADAPPRAGPCDRHPGRPPPRPPPRPPLHGARALSRVPCMGILASRNPSLILSSGEAAYRRTPPPPAAEAGGRGSCRRPSPPSSGRRR